MISVQCIYFNNIPRPPYILVPPRPPYVHTDTVERVAFLLQLMSHVLVSRLSILTVLSVGLISPHWPILGECLQLGTNCSFHSLANNWLTARNRVFFSPEKLTGPDSTKRREISHIFVIRKFITAFTNVWNISLSWTRSIQSLPPHATFLRSIAIFLSPTLGYFKWTLSLRIHQQNPEYTSPVYHTCYMPCSSHSSSFDHPNNVWWAV
jgi:hypothetical protein